jgi:hypothetical protein
MLTISFDRLKLRTLPCTTCDAAEVPQRGTRTLRRIFPHNPTSSSHGGSPRAAEAERVQHHARQTVQAREVDFNVLNIAFFTRRLACLTRFFNITRFTISRHLLRRNEPRERWLLHA